VIERNVREHDDPRAEHVRRVVASAQPGFDNGDVDPSGREREERRRGHDLELRRAARMRSYLCDRRLEVRLRSGDANPLAPASNVRRQIRAHA
jgi:hypothetical protein